MKTEKFELDHEIARGVVKGSEINHSRVSVKISSTKIDQTVSVLNENVDLGAPSEQIREAAKEPVAVLTEKKKKRILKHPN
ncbi:hypothetical protein HanHA300_Chr11g0425751 [Helianthus annuus]|nr:hypothetical protein HanHA300_Chr11g0425751 [Helianthus annuus]